jgi:pentatricopeptide repeat protein
MKKRDSVSYAVLMNGYLSNGRPLQCLQLLEQIKKSPATMTDAIAVPLVGACAQIGIVSICRRVLEHIHLKPQNYPRLRNVLIDMWARRISSRSFLTEREEFPRASQATSMKPNVSFN